MMINIEDRIAAFVKLGRILKSINDTPAEGDDGNVENLKRLIEKSHIYNPWFTAKNVRYAMNSLGCSLEEDKIQKWLEFYDLSLVKDSKKVGVVMAGNIPLVGFHDFLSVLIAGHQLIGKLSSDDQKLLPAIADILYEIEPGLNDFVMFTDERLENFDAIIATGSNNTSRYFEYYFAKYPHIIRKNRNGVAVFTGNETKAELTSFGKDLFMYFGMGCRSVSKVFVPVGYKFDGMFEAIEVYSTEMDQFKYKNNYEYYKSIFLINQVPHFDNGFLLVKKESGYASPPSVLFYEEYEDLALLKKRLMVENDQIQCVVGHTTELENVIPIGQAQNPELLDYADGIDTMKFLLTL